MHTHCYSSPKLIASASETACSPCLPKTLPLKRFQRFIEKTDWDRALIRREAWLNHGCRLMAGLAFLYGISLFTRFLIF